MLFVRKKDDNMKLYIYYKILNQDTMKNMYPLHRIDDLIDRLSRTSASSKIDMRSYYHQVWIIEDNISKTTLTMSDEIEKYESNRKLNLCLCIKIGFTELKCMDISFVWKLSPEVKNGLSWAFNLFLS